MEESCLGHNKRLIENIGSLTVLQGANYVLPLITLPYLVRVLGPEKFGLLAFAQAFIQYPVVVTDYGFNLSATREVSIHRKDAGKVSEIFCSVGLIKIGLMVASFLVMMTIVAAGSRFRAHWPLYSVTFLTVVGNVMFPVWYFQGMETMKYITVMNLISRLIATFCIFALVHRESDYLLAAGIQSGSFVIGGFLALLSVRRVAPIHFKIPPRRALVAALTDGWHVFVSTAAISLYTASNVFVLGLFTNSTVVGRFSAAERVIRAAHGMYTPVARAIYPHINFLVMDSSEKALAFIRRSLRWMAALSFAASALLFVFSGPIVALALGPEYASSANLLRWMSPLPFLIALSNVFGMQTMLTFGMNKLFCTILVLAGLINVALLVPLVYVQGAQGAAMAVVATETFVTITMGFALLRRGFNLIYAKESVA
jgi:PST family polysaccharide transporter